MKIILDLKVVMDTNVFVSGVFFSGPPYQILKAWQSGEFELVVSQEMPTAAPATEAPTSIPATSTPVSCQPSEILESQVAFGEIQGDMQSDGTLWALLFFKAVYVDAEAKIVWRITGEDGEFEAQARSEDGMLIQPVWEQYHESSTWERPGKEWGTGFNFPEPGCWTITVTYGETIGTITLKVLGS